MARFRALSVLPRLRIALTPGIGALGYPRSCSRPRPCIGGSGRIGPEARAWRRAEGSRIKVMKARALPSLSSMALRPSSQTRAILEGEPCRFVGRLSETPEPVSTLGLRTARRLRPIRHAISTPLPSSAWSSKSNFPARSALCPAGAAAMAGLASLSGVPALDWFFPLSLAWAPGDAFISLRLQAAGWSHFTMTGGWPSPAPPRQCHRLPSPGDRSPRHRASARGRSRAGQCYPRA